MNFEEWRHNTRAWLFHFIGNETRAYEEYVIAFRHNPTAEAARSLGAIQAKQDRFKEAAHWFAEAVRLDPDNAETWFNLGFVHERAGQLDEAIAAFRKSVELKPIIDRAWYGMGMAFAQQGNHPEATKALEEACKLQPLNAEGRYQLGMACFHSGDMKRTRATIIELKNMDSKRANKLIKDTGVHDFDDLITELPF